MVTHHAATNLVVDAIKERLERDGLADLVIEVPQGGAAPDPGTARKIERRPKAKTLKIYLPKVLRVEGRNCGNWIMKPISRPLLTGGTFRLPMLWP